MKKDYFITWLQIFKEINNDDVSFFFHPNPYLVYLLTEATALMNLVWTLLAHFKKYFTISMCILEFT